MKAVRWPATFRFPALDLLRLLIIHPQVRQHVFFSHFVSLLFFLFFQRIGELKYPRVSIWPG